MIDFVAVGQWTHKAIAQTRLSDARLALVLLDAAQSHHGDIDVLHALSAGNEKSSVALFDLAVHHHCVALRSVSIENDSDE